MRHLWFAADRHGHTRRGSNRLIIGGRLNQRGIDRIAECAIPYDLFEAEAKQPVQFYVELLENQQSRDRAPREGNITFAWPSPEFEQIMWDV